MRWIFSDVGVEFTKVDTVWNEEITETILCKYWFSSSDVVQNCRENEKTLNSKVKRKRYCQKLGGTLKDGGRVAGMWKVSLLAESSETGWDLGVYRGLYIILLYCH